MVTVCALGIGDAGVVCRLSGSDKYDIYVKILNILVSIRNISFKLLVARILDPVAQKTHNCRNFLILRMCDLVRFTPLPKY